jgi:hypothetical protein
VATGEKNCVIAGVLETETARNWMCFNEVYREVFGAVLQTRRRDENETGRTPSRNPENDREMSRQNENCPHAVFWRIEKVQKAENYRATSRRAEKCRAASRKRETEFLAENLGLVCNTASEFSQYTYTLFCDRSPMTLMTRRVVTTRVSTRRYIVPVILAR